MKKFSLVVFSIHSIFEILFGLNNYIKGTSSSLSAEQIATQTTAMAITFRFMGSALIALGVLGLIIIFMAGVDSKAARYVAIGFAVFHGLGSLGNLYTAAPSFEVYNQPMALGGLVLHAILAIGFVTIIVRNKGELN